MDDGFGGGANDATEEEMAREAMLQAATVFQRCPPEAFLKREHASGVGAINPMQILYDEDVSSNRRLYTRDEQRKLKVVIDDYDERSEEQLAPYTRCEPYLSITIVESTPVKQRLKYRRSDAVEETAASDASNNELVETSDFFVLPGTRNPSQPRKFDHRRPAEAAPPPKQEPLADAQIEVLRKNVVPIAAVSGVSAKRQVRVMLELLAIDVTGGETVIIEHGQFKTNPVAVGEQVRFFLQDDTTLLKATVREAIGEKKRKPQALAIGFFALNRNQVNPKTGCVMIPAAVVPGVTKPQFEQQKPAYFEKCAARIQVLHPETGETLRSSSIAISWVSEVSEDASADFCANCGSLANICDCPREKKLGVAQAPQKPLTPVQQKEIEELRKRVVADKMPLAAVTMEISSEKVKDEKKCVVQ